MEFGKRRDTTSRNVHNGLFPAPTCCRLAMGIVIYVADLLRGSRELVTDFLRGTGVMDFTQKSNNFVVVRGNEMPFDTIMWL